MNWRTRVHAHRTRTSGSPSHSTNSPRPSDERSSRHRSCQHAATTTDAAVLVSVRGRASGVNPQIRSQVQHRSPIGVTAVTLFQSVPQAAPFPPVTTIHVLLSFRFAGPSLSYRALRARKRSEALAGPAGVFLAFHILGTPRTSAGATWRSLGKFKISQPTYGYSRTTLAAPTGLWPSGPASAAQRSTATATARASRGSSLRWSASRGPAARAGRSFASSSGGGSLPMRYAGRLGVPRPIRNRCCASRRSSHQALHGILSRARAPRRPAGLVHPRRRDRPGQRDRLDRLGQRGGAGRSEKWSRGSWPSWWPP